MYDNIEEIYEGLTPTTTDIGYGGIGSKIEKIYMNMIINFIAVLEGMAGYYGELNDENEEDFTNKYINYINKNIDIAGKRLDGSIVITNTTDLSKKFINISSRVIRGIVILITSKNENNDNNENDFRRKYRR